MNIADIAIPKQYRAGILGLAVLVVLALVGGLSAWGGWTVSKWRADAQWSKAVAKCDAKVTDLRTDVADRDKSIAGLKASLATQNAAVARLAEQSEAVAQAQEQARRAAEAQAKASERRVAALKKLIDEGATPDAVLQTYWETAR